MRKSRLTWGLAFVSAGVVFARQDLRAGGTIDTSGATLAPGDAASPGTVTIDSAADLGAVPPLADVATDAGIDDEYLQEFKDGVFVIDSESGYGFGGLGGPNFSAHANVTLSAREHNFGSFTVDEGVTVTIAPGTTVHVAGAARIDGRLAMQGSSMLDCGGDLTVVGHAGSTPGGIVGQPFDGGPIAYNGVNLPGRLTVTADEGARVRLDGNFAVYGHVAAVVEHADTLGLQLWVGAAATLDDCAGLQIDVNSVKNAAFAMTGCAFAQANLNVGGATTLTDVTIAALSVQAPTGSLRITGTSSVGATTSTQQGWFNATTLGDLLLEDGVACSMSNLSNFGAWSYRGRVLLGAGVQIDARTTGTGGHSYLQSYGHEGVELRGSLKSDDGVDLSSGAGDVVLGDDAVLSTPGQVRLHAQGAVTAAGGGARIVAGDFDVRCVDGDLDLDVASVSASDGQIVAISNGQVKLRGAFASKHDVQILSRKDSIDVSGATIGTADAGASLSGFVRLATYASNASIDASDSSLATGGSDGQSGDILLQIAQTGGTTTAGALRIAGVTTRDSADGPVTVVKGTVRWKRRQFDFAGSNRLSSGALLRHLFLSGKRGLVKGSSKDVDLQVKRTSATSSSFVMTLRDGGGAVGESVAVTLQKAGFSATGKFKRPKPRKR